MLANWGAAVPAVFHQDILAATTASAKLVAAFGSADSAVTASVGPLHQFEVIKRIALMSFYPEASRKNISCKIAFDDQKLAIRSRDSDLHCILVGRIGVARSRKRDRCFAPDF